MALTKDERTDAILRIQQFARDERGEDMGDLAAGIQLDFIERELAPLFYNAGVRDAKALAQRFHGTLAEELESLEMRVRPGGKARRAS